MGRHFGSTPSQPLLPPPARRGAGSPGRLSTAGPVSSIPLQDIYPSCGTYTRRPLPSARRILSVSRPRSRPSRRLTFIALFPSEERGGIPRPRPFRVAGAGVWPPRPPRKIYGIFLRGRREKPGG